MTIGRLAALLALIAGVWWGISGRPAQTPSPRDELPPAEREREPGTAIGPDGVAPSSLGTILGRVLRGGEPATATVEVRRLRDFETVDAGNREERLAASLGLVGREVRGPPLASHRSTADGRFVFPDLPPGRYEVRALSPGGQRGLARTDLMPPGHRSAVTVFLPEGDCTVRGRLRWADGRPCRGTVWAGGIFGPRKSVAVQADAEGRFEITGLGTGWQQFSVGIGSRHVANVGGLRLPTETDVTLWIGESGWEVGGHVLDHVTGRPVPGALVFAGSRRYGTSSTRTDEDGAFRVFSVGGYNADLTVLAEGYSPLEVFQPGERTDLAVSLFRHSAVFGRVLDAATREPVSGIPVFAQIVDHDGVASLVRGVTDAEGEYRLTGVPAGILIVAACGRGRISRGAADRGTGIGQPLLVTAPPGGEVRVDLLVVPTVAIAGRVVTHAGEPVESVLVRAVAEEHSVFHALGEAVPSAFMQSVQPAVLSSPDGRFRLVGVAPHLIYRLRASDGGDRTVRLPEFLVPAAGLTGIDIRLPEILVVTATVTDAVTGEPMEGARVQTGADADELWGKTRGRTNGEGRALLRFERGDGAVVRADHPEYAVDRRWTPIAADRSVQLVLTRGAEVEGIVRFEDGAPAAKGVVEWDEKWRTGKYTCSEGRSTEIASDGTFRVGGLRDMKYGFRATVTSGGATFTGRAEVLAGTKNAEIRLGKATGKRAAEGIRILVLDPDDRPVPAGHARTFPGFGMGEAQEGALCDGRALLNGSRSRIETIEVFALRDALGRALPWAPTRLTEIPAGDEEIVIRLSEGKSMVGRVVDDAGTGLRGVRVEARPTGDWHSPFHAHALTEEAGRFLLPGLVDGEYRLSTPAVEGYCRSEPTTARSGATDVVIRLTRGRSVELRFVDPDGRPVADAGVTVLTDDGEDEIAAGSTGWNGRVRLTGLPSVGRLTLDVGRPGDRPDLLPFRIDDWAAESGTLRFARSYRLRGVVVDGNGTGVPECRVTLTDSSGRQRGAWTEANGAFRFKNLAEGEVRLRAQIIGPERDGAVSEEVVASAGSEDVRIPVDPGPCLAVRVLATPEERKYLTVRLFRKGAPGEDVSATGDLDERGRAVFRSLRAKTGYTLWIGPSKSGKCFFQEGVLPSPEEFAVRLVAGQSISGRVVMPDGKDAEGVYFRVTRGGIYADEEETGAGGRFTLRGLPPGTYEIEAMAEIDDVEYVARGRVEAGGSVELEMRRDED